VNWTVMIATILLVAGFRSSSALAGAYGVAVSLTMIITTVLAYVVARDLLGWSTLTAVAVTVGFLIGDCAFLGANLAKIADGGWFPLLIAAVVFTVMTTWRRGRQILTARLREGALSPELFVQSLRVRPPVRVPGTAVFMHRSAEGVPPALLHSLKHFQALHQRVVFLTVEFRDVPWVPFEERVVCERLGHDCWRVRVRYGFMNRPDVTRALEHCGALGLEIDPMQTSFFVSRQRVVPAVGAGGMALWRERIFAAMARNAGNVTDYFNIPTNRVVELGTRVLI